MIRMKYFFSVVTIVLLAASISGCGSPATTNTTTNTPAVTNTNTASNINSVTNTNTSTGAQTVTGQVFVKSYSTPSESYGILLPNGQEIGMGAYDTMREQLRPYVGENISVTFTSVCDPTSPNCCRTVFDRCGIVKSWKPADTKK